ncbi:unnamed protein product [Rotaria socialis]
METTSTDSCIQHATGARRSAFRILILSHPRSGSSLLSSYLMCHPRILLHGELLNDEKQVYSKNIPTLLEELDNSLSVCCSDSIEGFKLHVCQLFDRNIEPLYLIRRLNINFVIVMWRRSLLDSFVSLKIAQKTDCWYTETEENINPGIKVYVDETKFIQYCHRLKKQWETIAEAIGTSVPYHIIEYTDLTRAPTDSLKPIFFACGLSDITVTTAMKKQNPSNPADSIMNWNTLNENCKTAQLQVDKLFDDVRFRHSLKTQPWWPDIEPKPNSGTWTYRVAVPFISYHALSNVFKSLVSHSISSAAYPVAEMAHELRRLFDVPVAQPCANGFISLLLALQSAHIGEDSNDCVLVPSFTMIAVPNAVLYAGATPIFVDNSCDKYNPGVDEYDEAARLVPENYKIKAIIVTHTYSIPADIEQLHDMCVKNNWLLIEDISESIGVTINGKLLGTFGSYACASLYANKIITAGDGGFVLSKDPSVATRLASIVNHGFTPSYHFVHFEPCINGKINGLGAALVTPAIKQISQVIHHRSCMAQWYRQGLCAITEYIKFSPRAGDADGPWVFGIECQSRMDRDRLRHYLAFEHGIETRNYFPSLNIQAAFDNLPTFARATCPHAMRLAEIGFYLPSHYWLREDDVFNICQAIIAFYNKSKDWKMPTNNTLSISSPITLIVNNCTGLFESFGGSTVKDRQVLVDAVRAIDCIHKFFGIHRECWSLCKAIESLLNKLADESSLDNELRSSLTYYGQYLKKIRTQNHLLPIQTFRSPWLDFTLIETNIPTTTPTEVQQLLCWLAVKNECYSLVELGSWLGGTSVQLLHAIRQHSMNPIYFIALDGFCWQQWMNNHLKPWKQRAVGRQFLEEFKANINKFINIDTNTVAIPVQLNYDTSTWPELAHIFTKPLDLIYVDISDNEKELEELWQSLQHQLIPNKTIIVIHTYGLAQGVCRFVEQYLNEWKPLYKPATFAKAFIFLGKASDITVKQESLVQIKKKLKFAALPSDWNHHRAGGFCAVIDIAKNQLHHDCAPTLFIPTVEQYFFECDYQLQKPWVGIVHQAPVSNTVWMPDVERLLHSPQFLVSLNFCRGLFALSTYLCDYIKLRLPKSLSVDIPVSRLFYPISGRIQKSITTNARSSVVMIGGYMRDIDDFLKLVVPNNFEKIILLNETDKIRQKYLHECASQFNIKIINRLSDEEYEQLLLTSIPFLSLKSDGIASTLLIECIWSCTPIMVRRFQSMEEYLGRDYPLFFDSLDQAASLLSSDVNNKNYLQLSAMNYLANMNKDHLTSEAFIRSIANSASYLALPESPETEFPSVDLTICICSYRRTEDLLRILRALLYEQDFNGTFEVILWNNDFDRRSEVERICGLLNKRIRMIHSSDNYYCIVRMCMLHLMNSELLLTIDDDMIPSERFLSTFVERRNNYGARAILCLHGHKFLPHTLNAENPKLGGWEYGVSVVFIDDNQPPDTIHFAHADGCLFPRQALRDAASIDMPTKEFILVDDYWLSFVLNHYFGYQLCKIAASNMYTKTPSADDSTIALYLNPKVRETRMKLYIYHMLKGWPRFNISKAPSIVHTMKTAIWQSSFIGYNVPMCLTVADMRDLQHMNVRVVRLGACCTTIWEDTQETNISDLAYLLPQCMGCISSSALQRLVSYIDLFSKHNIQVILTLHRHLASPQIWQQLAAVLGKINNVIGYDLINEPYTASDEQKCVDDLFLSDHSSDDNKLMIYYAEIIDAIRREDNNTPVIIESSFWANWRALHFLKFDRGPLSLHANDADLFKVSFHMYEPRLLTTHRFNQGRFAYPGIVPNYDGPYALSQEWNSSRVNSLFDDIELIITQVLGLKSKHQVLVGELGISRNVSGASEYLRDLLSECYKRNWSTCLYSFRESHWNLMDYELGVHQENENRKINDNPLMEAIKESIQRTT